MNQRIISHDLFANKLIIKNEIFVEKTFSLIINRPGTLTKTINATGTYTNPLFNNPIDERGGAKPTLFLPLKGFSIKLKDPLGNPFDKNTITESDLNKYRNLRGSLESSWTAIISSTFKGGPTFKNGSANISIKVQETVKSSSAKPIIDVEATINGQHEFEFDLYRLGDMRISITKNAPFITLSDTRAIISLFDPDGNEIRRNTNGSYTITMVHLKKSRKEGIIQNWKLRVSGITGKRKIFAQVYETLIIPNQILLDRIKYLLGANGENFELKINWKGDKQTNRITLKSNTDILSENLEMYDVLGMIQDIKNTAVRTGSEYILYENPFKIIGVKYNVRFKNIKLTKFKVDIIKSSLRKYDVLDLDVDLWPPDFSATKKVVAIPAGLPTIRFEFETTGQIEVKLPGPNPGPIKLPQVILEIAFDKNKDGRISCLGWIDIKTKTGPLVGEIFHLLKLVLLNNLTNSLNTSISTIMEGIFDNILGGVFNFTNTKWENDSIKLEYIPDVLSERKPNPNYNQGDPNVFSPGVKTDSWKSPLLTEDPDKIKHIVVLMMENRSFDHVLGYLSLDNANGNGEAAVNPLVKGLTPLVKEQFSTDKYKIQHLKNAKFKESTTTETGKIKTKIPIGVGHSYKDVSEQLEGGTMRGFVKNFLNYHSTEFKEDVNGNTPHKVHPQDVLGYYTDEELKMYKYLTDNFAICDNYFSSHPGPTLPNRMFSLSGDLQKDRNGEPIIENSADTSFFLSRELTIFDILDQYKVSWKVYESFPSVTMLRMFSRYAGENKRIVSIDQLESDLNGKSRAYNSFPSVVFIDPAMHDAPMNDDHPPADMLHGQHLIKKVYDTLRSNEEVWKHTLLLINYDEHGGLFDHVSPPVAETYEMPLVVGLPGDTSNNAIKPPVKVKFGVRVPCFVVSPYVEKGSVFSKKLDHTSVLKTILVKFCGNEKPFLSDRVNSANNFGDSLKSGFRKKIPTSPEEKDILFPDDYAAKSKLQVINALAHNFTPMSKEKLSSKDADFHEMLAFLGRMVKPPIEEKVIKPIVPFVELLSKKD